jgi:hypothetical protein
VAATWNSDLLLLLVVVAFYCPANAYLSASCLLRRSHALTCPSLLQLYSACGRLSNGNCTSDMVALCAGMSATWLKPDTLQLYSLMPLFDSDAATALLSGLLMALKT